MNSNINQNRTKDESDLFGAGLVGGIALTITLIGGAIVLSEFLSSNDSSVSRPKTNNNLSDLINDVLKEVHND